MIYQMKRILLLIFVSFLCFSCKKEQTNREHQQTNTIVKIDLKYAQQFSIDEKPEGYLLHLKDKTYHLIRRNACEQQYPKDTSADSAILIPVKRIASVSGTHLEFFHELDSLRSIVFTCDSDFIYSPNVKEKIRSGEITPLGNSMQLDVERLFCNAPDVLLVSDASELPSKSCCPQIVCQEWKEENVLARAEWIKFFALFTDQLDKADSLFNQTEKNYLTIKRQAELATERPTLFAGGSWCDTWYLTGGKGYMAQLYHDAHADFLLADTAVGTVTCGLEWTLTHMKDADYWLNCGVLHAKELDTRLSVLKSVQEEKVFHFNKRSVSNAHATISDFYESAVAHPDVLLEDVVKVLHPSLANDSLLSQPTTYIDRVSFHE